MMKKFLTAGLLASLMMTGSALAMDSAIMQEHRDKIQENYIKTADKEGKVAALEERVEAIEELIEMIVKEMES